MHSFCWTARSLLAIVVSGLGALLTHYVDDYPTVEFASLAADTTEGVDELFGLLGWETKSGADFSSVVSPLGVVCDFSRAHEGFVEFTNKPERVEELRSAAAAVASAGRGRAFDARQDPLRARADLRPLRGRRAGDPWPDRGRAHRGQERRRKCCLRFG